MPGERGFFLVTTANEAFWDTSRPLLFLGDGCRRFERRAFLETLDTITLDDAWASPEAVTEASAYVDGLYERYLGHLAKALNEQHGVSYSLRYWRIFVGPWLLYYIPTIFDRYTNLLRAFERYPGLGTIVLDESSWVGVRDTLEFVQLLKDDQYNLQIYSRILKTLGYEFPGKKADVSSLSFQFGVALSVAVSIRQRARKMIEWFLLRFAQRQKVILRNSYFSFREELQLMFWTRGMVWPITSEENCKVCIPGQEMSRDRLSGSLPSGGSFEHLLSTLLPFDLPRCFLEDYRGNIQLSRTIYPAACRAIFSSVGWYFDESFKLRAASAAENHEMLVGMQHGGNYGCLLCHPSEKHEIDITDRYYTWGWNIPALQDKVKPMYSSKLTGRKQMKADDLKSGILYISTSLPRYLMQFPFVPARFESYLGWQEEFVRSLASHVRGVMNVRLHREDYGWDIRQRWNHFAPEIPVVDWNESFVRSMEKRRLYVCDHLGTTYLEALSANKPTILFWNPDHNECRPEAQPYFDALKRVGILFDRPDSAAHAVGACYDHVEEWWNEPDRQATRKMFCERFAKTGDGALGSWISEFRHISSWPGKYVDKEHQ